MLRIDAHILALKAEIMMSAAERRLHSDDFKVCPAIFLTRFQH